jgi:D-methionine transport system substrate-binding protein
MIVTRKDNYKRIEMKERKFKMRKKLLTTLLAATLAIGTLAGCGSSSSDSSGNDNAGAAADTQSAASTEQSAAVEDKGTITVAASATPHAEILEQAKPILAEQGWDLEVTVFDDYVQPNEVVESGDFDANYFQHIPYLETYNEENGTHLVNVGGIHYEPFGIYPGTKSSLDDLSEGDVIAIPNDTTNEARALLLLQDNGIITLKDGVGLEATVNDIEENPKNIEFEELEAAQIARVVDEVSFIVLNGNYALESGIAEEREAVAIEQADSEAAQTYVNVIAVKEGNEDNEGVKALVDVLKSDEIKQYINDTYDGAVVPFED